MNSRTKILILAQYFHPAYKAGGPVRSIYNLVAQLSDKYDFKIISSDRDLGDKTAFRGIEVNRWVHHDEYSSYYRTPAYTGLWKTRKLIRSLDYDIIYLNSFFSFKYSILILVLLQTRLLKAKKIVLAPRGELSQNAVKLKSAKKKIFLSISKLLGLHKNICWHITSELELAELRSFKIHLEAYAFAPNLAARIPVQLSRIPKKQRSVRMVFLSRISRKKNLHYALKLLSELKSEADILFDIYGPIEDTRYWAECKKLIELLPGNIAVNHKGSIKNELVNRRLSDYHLFFFPTLSENYGHVIYEALAAGCMVLISTETPWRNLEEHGVGWDIALGNDEGFLKSINILTEMEETEFQERRMKCKVYLQKVSNIEKQKEDYDVLFKIS